jgi:hypothetical protein
MSELAACAASMLADNGHLGHRKKLRIANTRPYRQSQLKEPVIRRTSVKNRVSGHAQGAFPATSALVDMVRE